MITWLLRGVLRHIDARLDELYAALLHELPELITNEAKSAARDARNTEARVRRKAEEVGVLGEDEGEDRTGQVRLPLEGEHNGAVAPLDAHASLREASRRAMFGRGR